MTRPLWTALFAVAAAGAAAALLPADGLEVIPAPLVASGYPPADEGPMNRFRFVGSASCSSTDCHHKGGIVGDKGSEYTTWARPDPHHKAYEVLFDSRSVTIQKNRRTETPAQADALCLKCHTLNVPEARQGVSCTGDESLRVEKQDGVACESCHGPAEKWLRAHVQVGWKGMSRAEKFEQYGFAPTDDLSYRVRMCSACHVGRDNMEVDHVLIAAGHPRLAFEYTGFHHIYPRHWRETEYGKDFEARAWTIGQLGVAKAGLELLAARASRAEAAIKAAGADGPKVEWPEFTEYDCYACHHGLTNADWRKETAGFLDRKAGALPWGTWLTPLYNPAGDNKTPVTLPGLTAGLPAVLGAADDFAGPFDDLRKEMEKPFPNPAKVSAKASILAAKLGVAVGDLQARADIDARAGRTIDPTRVKDALTGLIDAALPGADKIERRLPGYDQATQHYLAVAAMYLGHKELTGGPACSNDALVKDVANKLRFPRPTVSPAGELEVIDGPTTNFTPRDYRKALEALRNGLKP